MNWGKRLIFVLLLGALCVLIAFRVSGKSTTAPDALASPEPTPIVFATPPVSLTAVLSAEQLRALDSSALQTLDLTGSTCYDEIEEFIEKHPTVEVVYQVLIEGGASPLALAPDVETLELHEAGQLPSIAENARHLPKLHSIHVDDDIAESEAVDALREAFPEAEVSYSLSLQGQTYPYDTEELTLSGLNAQTLEALLPELERFKHVQAVNLPQDDNEISLEDATRLSAAYPLLNLNYQIELFGQQVGMDAERLEFENLKLGEEDMTQLRALLPAMHKLNYLKLDDCGFSNDEMVSLRDDFPNIKVVWRVHFGNYHCLTDTEMIWATGGSVNDSTAGVLKYCSDVKYIDLGHSLITNVDFLEGMPKVEVAIFAITWVSDISAISNCKNLEYLEIFSSRITDLSPLAACTHLQHVNLGSQRNTDNVAVGPTDISSLYDLPELKRFYCAMSKVPESQQKEMIERHPDCEFEFGQVDPTKGYWRFIDGDANNTDPSNRNERYALLCEQFGYDTLQQSGKTWSLYG
ncbi:MAG: hypothetical protein IKI69_07170 [Oscillospiraceae bacterium]|nr:hypothetical protein [Oscillospiraceae bacterium]